MNKIKIWAFSDTHGKHEYLEIPEVDIAIFAGDATNSKNPDINLNELLNFLDWYEKINIKHKIFVAGNHETSIYRNRILKEEFSNRGIIYLENNNIVLEGLKIHGSPITPEYGTDWAFNVKRDKTIRYWDLIDDDTNILVTHGPPIGILDKTSNSYNYESTGDSALLKVICRKLPEYVIFGHLHDEQGIFNAGRFKPNKLYTTFLNVSICDLKQQTLNKGEIIECYT